MEILNLDRLKWLLPVLCLLSIGWMYTSLWTLHHTIEEFNSPMVFNIQFNVAVCSFLVCSFLSCKLHIGLSRKNSNISVLLWDVFYAATAAILVSLISKSALLYFLNTTPWTLKVWNLFEFIIYTFFIAHCFFSIKKLLLYQKTNRTIVLWIIFELSVFASILTSFFIFKYNSLDFLLYTLPLTALGVYLSFNVKWAAFLNFQQKLMALMLLIISFGIQSGLFLDIYEQHVVSGMALDPINNAFIMAISAFVILNIAISILVLLFSLPTSSVFEQKFGEVMLFQKLHQSIQLGETETEIHKALLESCCDSAMATGGWLEMTDANGRITSFENNGIDNIDAFNFKNLLRKNHIKITSEPQYIKDVKALSHLQKINTNRYRSLLLLPLLSGQHRLGTLVLLKDKVNAFDKEMVDMIITFMSQAAIAIQNTRLLEQALETERYREELKIAKQVQERLLPEVPHYSSDIEIAVLSGGATDVGGDYYDFYKDKAGDITVVLGDVSGHGTSAAFNMAQTKGIFQSLVQLNLDPIDFLRYANTALARCFEKSTFLTLLVIKISQKDKTLQIARAGHCLPLFYSNKQIEFIESKGTGLGVVRGKDYASFIECKIIPYQSGDSLLLYTDGIVEASNAQGELFGTDRLKNVFVNYKEMKANSLLDKIFQETKAFSGKNEPEDDSTLLLLKFI